ncbi:cysteine hydrolase family protein [Bradyrhizobium sp.]|uniref:cysteine hydrolase family protein n=1 Tax=Bradyrhizobium sp. TaxID=376 RepID=UPI0025C185B4|nr:cysteine hydrolase family protein [Bradyrhizobium sp.]
MSNAKTLLEFAGVQSKPANLTGATVIIIDAQNEYVDGQLPLHGIGQAVDKIAELIARARKAGAPIVHIVHKGRAGGLFDPDGNGGKMIERVLPSGARVISKTLPNAFAKTDLDAQLKAIGNDAIIIVGFATHMCVSATARAALDLGYRTTVVSDATATRTLPDPTDKGNIDAQDVHRVALAELADRFASVVCLNEIPL